MLVWGAQRPEGNWASTKLREPALQLGLGGVVGETSHVEHLAALRQESSNISTRIHGPREDVGMLSNRLGLADQTSQHASQGHCLLHSTTGRCWRQSLQVEGQVVLDGGTGLDGLDLQGGANVGQHGWAEGQRLGVVLLPALVFRPQVERAGVLEIGREDDGLVAGLAGQLDTQVPRVEGDEGEVEVLCRQVLRGKGVEPVDGIAEGASIADVFPRQGG